MSFRVSKKGQLEFTIRHKQLGNSADRLLFPKIIWALNFQPKTPKRSTRIAFCMMPSDGPGMRQVNSTTSR